MFNQFPSAITMLMTLENFGGTSVHRYYKRVRRALSFGSLLPPTPLHMGQNAHFAYEAIPVLDIYFPYLEVLGQCTFRPSRF